MEKRKPHYDLAAAQAAVKLRGADAFTATALFGAQTMGLDIGQAIDAVCNMTRADFFKSTTTHVSSQVWQDVYHPQTRRESCLREGDIARRRISRDPVQGEMRWPRNV